MPRHSQSRTSQQQVPYHVRKTTLLPSSLKDELVAAGKIAGPSASGPAGGRATSVLGRKQRRKDERNTKSRGSVPVKTAVTGTSSGSGSAKGKQRAQEIQLDRPQPGSPKEVSGNSGAEGTSSNNGKRKRVAFESAAHPEANVGQPAASTSNATQKRKVSHDQKTPLQRLLDRTSGPSGSASSSSSRHNGSALPRGNRTQAEKDEDDEIAWLEAKLGVRSNPGAQKELQEDGLDDLLDDLDRLDDEIFGSGGETEEEESALEDSEDEEDEDEEDQEDGLLDDEQDMEEDLDDEDDDEDQLESELEDLAGFDTDQENTEVPQLIVVDENGAPVAMGAEEEAAARNGQPAQSTAANGKEVAGLGAAAISSAPTKYVPPALRKAAAEAAAGSAKTTPEVQDPRLRRLLLGLLNRLSPTSFPTLVLNPSDTNSLHSIYMSHSRGVINTLLSSLILEIVAAQGDGIGETQVVVLSALVKVLSTGMVGGMNASGGKEIAANIVDGIVRRLDGNKDARKNIAEGEDGDKQFLNLVAFLAQLYNLQVIAPGLVYDFIKEFIGNGLKEKDVEALLKIMKVSGPQLRHDDPTALRQIIQLVQEAQKGMEPSSMSSRTKFMVETLGNLRNNKIKPPAGIAAEAEASLKKYISNLAKKASAPTEPLRISLADLRASGTKGKWWLVGAAWSGNPLVDRHEQLASSSSYSLSSVADNSKEAQLMKLAKKQGMNTDVRRRIFVALMSGEDYIDATSRLLALGLSEVQQREIVRVLLHCLASEKAYNPYYTLIVSRLLTNSPTSAVHSYQITLQYSLWDFFRSLGETEVGGVEMVKNAFATSQDVSERKIRNIAKAYGWWIAKSGLGLNILKPLSFPTLLPASRSFLAQMFTNLIRSTQSASPLLTSTPGTVDPLPLQAPFLNVGASHPAIAQGVAWFLNQKEMRMDKDEVIRWGRETVVEALTASR